VALPFTVLFRETEMEGKMTDWTPVLIIGLVVVCVTAYLLLDPKFRPPRKDR
jgi:hypothetical protein